MHKIFAGTYEPNIASQKVLLKCGFKQEACLKKHYFLTSEKDFCDLYFFGIINENKI